MSNERMIINKVNLTYDLYFKIDDLAETRTERIQPVVGDTILTLND